MTSAASTPKFFCTWGPRCVIRKVISENTVQVQIVEGTQRTLTINKRQVVSPDGPLAVEKAILEASR